MTAYWCERAWPGDGTVVDGLLVEINGGRISSTGCIPTPSPGAVGLAGLTVPGFANCHSHAFHRALRGRTQRGRGTFWTWRDQMYSVAARLEPDNYYAPARATYEEMALAGITAVGEFHYLHHQSEGDRPHHRRPCHPPHWPPRRTDAVASRPDSCTPLTFKEALGVDCGRQG